MIKAAVLSAVLGTSVLAGFQADLVNADVLASKRIYDSIAIREREQVLVDDRGYPVSGLAVVLNASTEALSTGLKPGTTWFNEVEVERAEPAIFTLPTRGYTSSSDAALTKLREEMKSEGINVAQVSEWRIVFKPYNVHIEDAEKTLLTFKLFDPKKVFRMPSAKPVECAVMIVDRVDHMRLQLRTFHLGVPLLGKQNSELRLVTDTELALLADIERKLGFTILGAVPLRTGSLSPYQSMDELRHLAGVVKKCGSLG